MEFWALIVKSNTFNFIIMVGLLAYIIKKLNLSQKFDDAISKVKETIDNSENAKINSINELKEADKQTKNVNLEIEEIENKAQENVANVREKLDRESEKRIDSITVGASKLISAKEREITSNLSKKTVLASFEIAKNHIVDLLKQNPDYHKKFIKESIEELDRLE